MFERHLMLVVVASALLVTLGALPACAFWGESFEYEDSPLNHGWVLAAPDQWPDPYTTTAVAWHGARSLRCEGYTDGIQHDFGDVDATYVSAYFYDDGDWGYHDEAVIYTRWDYDTQFLGLGKYMGPGSVYYIFDNWGTVATPVPVSVGWHHFEWMRDGSTVHLYIDDVHCGSYSGSTLYAVGLGAGEVGMYVDAISAYYTLVRVDIKPGSYPNAVNLGSSGVIPVAILSSAIFDATQVDPTTVELAGAGVAVRGKGSKYLAHEEDVDGDGLLDLVMQVETENLSPGLFDDGYAWVTGATYGGQHFEGSDEIIIVPPE